MPELPATAGLLTREAAADPTSTAFAQTTAMYREIMHTGMAYAWLVTPGNTRADQLAAGRAWVRVNLAAAATGLSAHPVSQALQEYPEMQGEAQALTTLLGVPAGTLMSRGSRGREELRSLLDDISRRRVIRVVEQ